MSAKAAEKPAAGDPAALRRYLASGAGGPAARGVHRADSEAFLPAVPVATFRIGGRPWEVYHARDLKGLRTFQRVVALLDEDPETRPVSERQFEILQLLVGGGRWKGDQWVPALPATAAQKLSRNEVDELVRRGTAGDRPQPGEGTTGPQPPSAASSPSTGASTPGTPTGS